MTLKPPRDNDELVAYLVWLRTRFEASADTDLVSVLDFAVGASHGNSSTEFYGESIEAFRKVLSAGGQTLSASELGYLKAVMRQLKDAMRRSGMR
jgi:hypothetical protein